MSNTDIDQNINLYFLHWKPSKIAKYLCDQHIFTGVKEIVELLSTIWLTFDSDKYNDEIDIPLKSYDIISMLNSKLYKWIILSESNYFYIVFILKYISEEFEFRYGYKHLYDNNVKWFAHNIPKELFGVGSFTIPPLSFNLENYNNMKEISSFYHRIQITREYYIKEKTFASWKYQRKIPKWYSNYKIAYKNNLMEQLTQEIQDSQETISNDNSTDISNNNHEQSNLKDWPCWFKECTYSVKSHDYKLIQKHQDEAHPREYPCTSCKELFNRKRDQVKHLKIVHNIVEKKQDPEYDEKKCLGMAIAMKRKTEGSSSKPKFVKKKHTTLKI